MNLYICREKFFYNYAYMYENQNMKYLLPAFLWIFIVGGLHYVRQIVKR